MPHQSSSTHHLRRGRRLRSSCAAAALLAVLGSWAASGTPLSATESSAPPTTASTAPSGTPSKGITGTPVHGEQLTIGFEAPPDTMDPAKLNVALDLYTALSYDALINRAPDGSLQPGLASSWKYVGEGNKEFELTLRDKLTFADGTPLDAAAVKASLEYFKGAGGQVSVYLASVTAIDVKDPSTVSIKLSAPNPMMPDILTEKYLLGQVISPAGLKDPAKLTPEFPSQGAGAYTYDPAQSVAGDHYTYVANKSYYAPDRQHYDRIVIKVIADPQAAMNALQAGQIDIMAGAAQVADQAKSAGVQIISLPFVWQGLNLIDRNGETVKAMGDKRVRQAINYAIDRKAVTEAVLGAYGLPTSTIQVPGGEGWTEQTAAMYPYDATKAKQLLADAGYPNGFELKVQSIAFAGIDVMAEAIKGQLDAVGIKVTLDTATDKGAYVGGVTDKSHAAAAVGYGAQPMFIMGHGLFLPDAAIFNGFKSADPKLQQLFDDAAKASDADRARLNAEILQFLTDEAWFAPVAFTPVFLYARADLGGIEVSPNAPTANALDWYNTK